MSDHIKTIQSLEKTIQDNKTEETKLKERLSVLKEERQKILDELKEQKIDEDELDDKIQTLEEDLNSKIEEIEKELE